MELSFEILANYDQLVKMQGKLEQFKNEYDNVCKKLATENVAPLLMQSIQKDIENVSNGINSLSAKIIDATKSINASSSSDLQSLSGNASEAIKAIGLAADEQKTKLSDFWGSVDVVRNQIEGLSESASRMSGAINSISSFLSKMESIGQQISSTTDPQKLGDYNLELNKYSNGIAECGRRLSDWNAIEINHANIADEVAQKQAQLSSVIADQTAYVDNLKQQVAMLNQQWLAASGTEKLKLWDEKTGREDVLTKEIAKLDLMKVKANELSIAFSAADSTVSNVSQKMGDAISSIESTKMGDEIRQSFEDIHLKCVVARDSLEQYNKEFSNISIQSAKILKLRDAISSLDAEAQSGAVAKLESEMRSCSQSIDQSYASLAKMQINTRAFDNASAAASKTTSDLGNSIKAQTDVVESHRAEVQRLQQAYSEATESNKASIQSQLETAQQSLKGEETALTTMQNTLHSVRADYEQMMQVRKAVNEGIVVSNEKAAKSQQEVRKQTQQNTEEQKKTSEEAKKHAQAVNGLVGTWKQFLGTIGVAAGLKAFISQMIDVNARMEQMKTSLYGIMQSKSAADQLFSSIRDVSSHSAIGLGSLTGVAQQFVAFGESAARIPKLLEAMNEVSMGSEQKFNRLASSLQMMAAMGQVNTRTIRSMITAGFNPLLAISKETGESMSDLMKKVKKGTIPVSEITNSFISATKEGGMFYKMNDKMSGTLSYQFAVMKKNVAGFFLELGKANDGTIHNVTKLIVTLTKHLKDFAEAAKIVVTFAGIKTGAYLAGQAITAMSTAMKVATSATIGLNTAMKASGWGTIISLAAAAGVALYDFYTTTNEANSALSNYNETVIDATGDAERLFATLENTDKTTKVHQDTLKELVDKYEEYGIHIDTSKGLLNDEVNITQQLIEKKGILIGLIREEASERAKAEQYKKFQEERDKTYKSAQEDITSKLNGAVATIGKNARKRISEGMAQGLSISILEEVKNAVPKIKNASTEFDKKRIEKEYAGLFKELGAKTNPYSKEIIIGSQSWRYTQQDIERLKVLNEVSKKTGIAAKDLGMSFVNSLRDTEDSLVSVEIKEQDFNKAVGNTSEDLDFNSLKLRYNKMSVEQLGSTIRDILTNYGNNDINFRINVDDTQVPKWMKDLGLDSKQLSQNAGFWLAQLQDMKKKKIFNRYFKDKNGKWQKLTQKDVAERAAQYQKGSEDKKAEEDKKAAEKEEKEKEEAKAERKRQAAQRKREAAQRKIEERNRRIKEATDNYKSSIKDAVSDLTADNEQQNNDLADDGVEKSMRDAELKYDKAVKDADSKIENVAKSLHALNKAKGSVAKSVEQLKKEILASGESSSEYGALIKAYNGALTLAGKTLQKSQNEIIDGLRDTYDKDNKERSEKVKKLRADIAALEKLASKATSDNEKEELNKLQRNAKAQLDWVAQSKDAWNDYYQKYGTFLEKRAALEEKFLHDTQGMDENTPEYLMLKKQKEEAESTLEAEEKLKDFDWMDAFGDLAKLSDTTLERVKNQLKDIIELDKTLNASDKAKFVEKYNQVSDQIEKRKESWSDYTGNNWVSNIFKNKQQDKYERKKQEEEYERAKQNYKDKIDEYNTAKSDQFLADDDLSKKKDALNNFLQQNGSSLNADSFQGMDMSQALNMLQQNGGDFSQMGQQFKSLFQGFQGAQQGAQTAAANASQAAQAMQGAQQGMQAAQGAMGGGGGGGGAAMTEAIIKGVNQNVQSLNQLVKKFGNEDSGFAQGMQDFAESSQEATEAFDSLKNGDVFGTILHLSNAVEKLGSSMAKFFGYNDGEVEYQKELKRYKKMSKIWDDLIQKKKEYISLTYGDETKKEIDELNALYKAEETSIRTLTKRFTDKRSWNAHSESYRNTQAIKDKALELNGASVGRSSILEYLRAVRGINGFGAWSEASGVNISKLEDLYEKDYSYKELLALKTAANGEYYGSLSEEIQTYIDKLMEAKKAQEDFAEDMKEKLTGVKFDTMVSDFMACLEDMNQGADDWVNSFKDKIRKAIIDNMMGTKVKEWLEDYTKRYQAAMDKGTLTDAERQQFIDEANEKSNEFFNERKEILENIGLGKSSDSSSTGGGFATASEESVEELSGRALAANEALYSIRDIQIDYRAYIEDIQTNLQGLKMSFDVSKELQENSYMELVEIRKNTGSSSKLLEQMKTELYNIRKKVDNI